MACRLKIAWSEIYFVYTLYSIPRTGPAYYHKSQYHFLTQVLGWSFLYRLSSRSRNKYFFFLLTIQKAGSPRANTLSNKLSSFGAGGSTEMQHTSSVVARRLEGGMARHQHFGLVWWAHTWAFWPPSHASLLARVSRWISWAWHSSTNSCVTSGCTTFVGPCPEGDIRAVGSVWWVYTQWPWLP